MSRRLRTPFAHLPAARPLLGLPFSASVLALAASVMGLAACADEAPADDDESKTANVNESVSSAGGSDAAGTGGATASSGGTNASSSTGSATTSGAGGEGVTTSGAGGAGGDEAPRTFLDSYPLDAQFPEGGIYDAVDHAFWVGSLGEGSVHRVDAQTGDEATIFTETAPGLWWTLGMAVDESRRRLWVCAMEDRREFGEDVDYDGYVWRFDLETGERDQVFALDDTFTDATCTDVAVASDGTVYVTDRDFGNVYAIGVGDDQASLFTSNDELTAAIIGQNAAVVLPGDEALLVALYLPSRLVRVDLVDGSVIDTAIDGSFFDATPLAGADGMTFHEGSIYVAFTSELVRIDPVLADWSTLVATEVDVPNGMTDVVSTPNGLYLLNGQAVSFAFGGDTDPFALTRFVGAL